MNSGIRTCQLTPQEHHGSLVMASTGDSAPSANAGFPIQHAAPSDADQARYPSSSTSMQSMRGSPEPYTPPATPGTADSSLAAKGMNSLLIKRRECDVTSADEPPAKVRSSKSKHPPHSTKASGPGSGLRAQRSPVPRQQPRRAKPKIAPKGSEKGQTDMFDRSDGSRLAAPFQNTVQSTVSAVTNVSYAAAAAGAAAHQPGISASEEEKPPQPYGDFKPGMNYMRGPGDGQPPGDHPLKARTNDRPSKAGKPVTQRFRPVMQSKVDSEYSGMLLQPDSSPISEEALAVEIDGIYAGVGIVEQKCIDIDAALARDTKTLLEVEQWQALIALHRTLLYEHHDFLMATQHPSASEELNALASKYSMPARMWKHGIHAFLEVLRHRRPNSQDYMLAFVVLAYQMMALLFETVPCFTDTWIECLGDLARYRMAIEDDREMHAVWGGVAARWYTLASDRHPETGRLYHHLGILERPSMRKLTSYAKSLTCSVPFLNARDSMATFCTPIVQEEHVSRTNVGSAEALLVTFFALVFLDRQADITQTIAGNGLRLLSNQPSVKTKEFGPQVVLSSLAAMFEFGSNSNIIRQSFLAAVSEDEESDDPVPTATKRAVKPNITGTTAAPHVTEFYFTCFNTLVHPRTTQQSFSDMLSSIHVILAWFHSLNALDQHNRVHNQDPTTKNTIDSLLNAVRFSWGELCLFLNRFCQENAIDDTVFEAARQGNLPGPQDRSEFVALAEDYWMRGLLWAQLYLPKGLLPARTDEIESAHSGGARVQRVQWLALSLAFRTKYIKYNVHKKMFEAPVQGPMVEAVLQPIRVDSLASHTTATATAPSSRASTWQTRSTVPTSPTSTAKSSTTASTAEDSDGFTVVPRPKRRPAGRSYAKVAAAAAPKKENKTVRIASTFEEVR